MDSSGRDREGIITINEIKQRQGWSSILEDVECEVVSLTSPTVSTCRTSCWCNLTFFDSECDSALE
jgi:hypothetical protein